MEVGTVWRCMDRVTRSLGREAGSLDRARPCICSWIGMELDGEAGFGETVYGYIAAVNLTFYCVFVPTLHLHFV